MRVAGGNEQLPPVMGAELNPRPAAEGRRRAADVDRDVENAAGEAPDQLRLRMGRPLEVKATQSTGLAGQRLIVLTEIVDDAVFGQPLGVVRLAEPSALVAEAAGGDYDGRHIFLATVPAPAGSIETAGR